MIPGAIIWKYCMIVFSNTLLLKNDVSIERNETIVNGSLL